MRDPFMEALGLKVLHLAPGEAVVAGEVRAGVVAPRQQQVGALWVRAKQGLLFRQVVVLAGLAFFRLVRWRLVCLPQAY